MHRHSFIFSDAPRYRIQRHLAFWLFWWLFQGFLYAFSAAFIKYSYTERVRIALVDSFGFMPCHMFISYALMYFVIPRYIIRHKYLAAVCWTLLFFSLTGLISTYISRNIVTGLRYSLLPAHMKFPYDPYAPTLFYSLLAGLRGGITIGGLAAAIKLMKYWYLKEQRNLQLQAENAATGLQILRAQIHPHFLFNTLNNIYANTQVASPAAAKMITGLSDILRYTLQVGAQQIVPLQMELQMIQDYISLEKIRYGNKLDLHIQIPENTQELSIAPLLLLPLVENCFKHGTSTVLDQPWIHLQIAVTGNQMQMKLLNGKSWEPREEQGAGIGLMNVRKRLELLYAGKHELTVIAEEEIFIVHLKLELEGYKAEQKYHSNKLVYA